jgi:hypothetical protein
MRAKSEILKSPNNLAFLTTTPHLSPPLLCAPSDSKTKMNLNSDGTTYTIVAGTALGRQDKGEHHDSSSSWRSTLITHRLSPIICSIVDTMWYRFRYPTTSKVRMLKLLLGSQDDSTSYGLVHG